MTYTSLIKIGRIFVSSDSLRPGTTYFQRGALQLGRDCLDRDCDDPVVVDHDLDRQIGVVRELVEIPDTDGVWLAALATITERPSWLKPGTRASFSYKTLQRQQFGDCERILRGWVDEVSVLSSGVRPVESAAQVLTVTPALSPAVRPTSSDRAAGEVILGGQRIVRHGIGQVLGVR